MEFRIQVLSMRAMSKPFGIDCHILKDVASFDGSRSNRAEEQTTWGPWPRGWPLLAILQLLFDGSLHHTPDVVINPSSEVPRLAGAAIRSSVYIGGTWVAASLLSSHIASV